FIGNLFNSSQALFNSIVNNNTFAQWTACGAQDTESQTCLPTNQGLQFQIGTLNCTAFMQKYIYPAFGRNMSMLDPVIDSIPLNISDWYDSSWQLPGWQTTNAVSSIWCSIELPVSNLIYNYAY